MAEQTITIRFDMNEKQEKVIDDVMAKLNGDFNYISGDVLMAIVHSPLFYEFTNEKRQEYDDLVEPIYEGIIEHESSLMIFK